MSPHYLNTVKNRLIWVIGAKHASRIVTSWLRLLIRKSKPGLKSYFKSRHDEQMCLKILNFLIITARSGAFESAFFVATHISYKFTQYS